MGTIAEKLEYLDGTREKILTETNRLGVGLTEQDKFRDYAKGLYDGYVDILNNGIDTLYDNMEKVSGSGSDITLENIEEAPMRSDLEGDTYQFSTTGKNLFNPTYTFDDKGVEATINNQEITFNGTATSNGAYKMADITMPSGTYTISLEVVSGTHTNTKNIWFDFYNGNTKIDNGSLKTTGNFTKTFNTNITKINLGFDKEDVLDNFTFKVQIESGSSATSWEEYTNGASPNPDYPQPINVVSGRQEVSVVGKNLFDNTIQPMISDNFITISTTDTGKKLVWGGSGSANYKFVVFAIMDLTNYVGKTIRFKCNFTASGSNIPQVNIGLCNADGSNRTSKTSTKISGTTISFTVPTLVGEQKYLLLNLYINELGTLTQNDYVEFTDMILTIDNEDMTYEAYKGQSYEINLGKNLWNYTITQNSSNRLGVSAYAVEPNTTYTISTSPSNIQFVNYYKDKNQTDISNTGWNSLPYTFTTPSNCYYIANLIRKSDNSNLTPSDIENVQLEKGSQATSYSEYKTPIELCKIGTYQDKIYKENRTWYLHKEIGKVVLDGSESWDTQSIKTNTTAFSLLGNIGYKATGSDSINAFTNYFKGNTNGYNVDEECFWFNGNGYLRLRISNTLASTVADFKTWLSTHNTIVYYVLATPTTTEITDSELLTQLNNWYNQKSIEGETNISVISEDLPAILNVKALKQYE